MFNQEEPEQLRVKSNVPQPKEFPHAAAAVARGLEKSQATIT